MHHFVCSNAKEINTRINKKEILLFYEERAKKIGRKNSESSSVIKPYDTQKAISKP